MRFEELARYSALYASVGWGGAGTVLNEALGFPGGQAVPLSIAHGVDFGMCRSAMDVQGPAPIHWAYNDEIDARASAVKRCIRLPHPWWFVAQGKAVGPGRRRLVIGPPPGRTNDERLLSLLRARYDAGDLDILLKQRGNTSESRDFWRRHGIGDVTAGPQDDKFYDRLFDLLARYETIVCTTFSSAAIFAAAIGKQVEFVRGYRYLAYDVPDYTGMMDFESRFARNVVATFVDGDREDVSHLARKLLGFTTETVDSLRARYVAEVMSLDAPTAGKSMLHPLLREVACLSGRPSLASLDLRGLARRFAPRHVVVKEIDELSIWEEGANEANLKIRRVEYAPGKTEPGFAVDGHEPAGQGV